MLESKMQISTLEAKLSKSEKFYTLVKIVIWVQK